jgi:tellurite resistance protein TehA-like permease
MPPKGFFKRLRNHAIRVRSLSRASPWSEFCCDSARRTSHVTDSSSSSFPTQGTGIVNTLLFDLPWKATHPTFRAIGAAFLVFDMGLFISFTIISLLRYSLYPAFFLVMLKHETHSLFLGTIPMGFVTIISGIAKTGAEYNIEKSLDVALVLWWIALGTSPFQRELKLS